MGSTPVPPPRPARAPATPQVTAPTGTPPRPRPSGARRTTEDTAPVTLPPPAASARFPDAPPSPADGARAGAAPRTDAPATADAVGATVRPRPVPAGRAPWRPVVTFAQPDTGHPGAYHDDIRPRPGRARIATAAACAVLGLGLVGGAVAGSLVSGDAGEEGNDSAFAAAGRLWHSVPVDRLFPPTVEGDGAGPGGADRTWTRIAVAPDGGCADAFDPLLEKALAPVGCARLLRATYTDATRSNVTTVGLLFTEADPAAMTSLKSRFRKDRLDRRTDLMPRPYAAENTAAAGFGDDQRASWTLSVLTDAPVVVYAVSGFADGRAVSEPQPAGEAVEPGATTAPAQSGLGHEAKGLADRIERGLRKDVTAAEESS
ncbi:hypothetical protein GCM10010145_30330 [Streptomyces ruber]|uniref:Uncharacterized protein n=1 Tax=Streptomyces ruber TaxID=83378 RepID=A0A918BCM6_9ACTN|nr:hypothetical protein [Streptomyces ruber]GGQ58186.1 hypothetical protein GCM10010145_30330 [Streptomyces ruber]